MGKRILQQRRGRGYRYKSPGHKFKGAVKYPLSNENGIVVDIIHCAGHSAPLMIIDHEGGDLSLNMASKGIKVGDTVSMGQEPVKNGVVELKNIPEGSLIYNIEARPGDGGKFVRTSGAFAKVLSKTEKGIRVKLPSRKEKLFLPGCRATIGNIAGGGRTEKPFLKAGTKFHKMKAKGKLYPKVCGVSMNSVDHPFGGSCSHSKGRPTQSPRSAPPGRKVGKIAPSRTGRKK